MQTIFEKSQANRFTKSLWPANPEVTNVLVEDIVNQEPKFSNILRKSKPNLPQVSELEVVRHYALLAKKNFCIDTNFYPLGSCTMKYNPKIAHKLANIDNFANQHPLTACENNQGILENLFELQEYLKIVTGMQQVSLAPMAGAQGELAGVMMIKAYHAKNNDLDRVEMLVPDAAHGTNPASAVMCGFTVKEIPTTKEGDIDLDALKASVGPKTAGIMLTNPSTMGVFERDILEVAKTVHEAGGLLYYDGANLNAILGKVTPGEMGFDVIHMNLHKTFATPHGAGGPGCGPVAANDKLKEFLPVPMVYKHSDGYKLATEQEWDNTIGRMSAFNGNVGVMLRAHTYIRLLGKAGIKRVAEYAVLNANYLMEKLAKIGYTINFPSRRASHEFIVTLKQQKQELGITALDVAKRMLDYGIHAPTVYFPISVPECLLIEPTETESKQTLDEFLGVMQKIWNEMYSQPDIVKNAPVSLPISRVDEVKAARDLNLRWEQVERMAKKKLTSQVASCVE